MARWRRSGQTASQYASEHGLHEGTLACWATKLRGSPEPEQKRPRFVPVRVTPSRAGVDRVAEGSSLEVMLRSGCRVRVEAGFDVELLRRVIAVVDGGVEC